MASGRIPVTIPIRPWFRDHCFNNRIILPAVETMCLLADVVKSTFPETEIRLMEAASFARFLDLPPGAKTVEALVECLREENGRITARLLTRRAVKSMTRLYDHGTVSFRPDPLPDSPVLPDDLPGSWKGRNREIPATEIYRSMVPFGQAYRTLTSTLRLTKTEARGTLQAPELPPEDIHRHLGSPFSLDGAMHAACVLGRQLVDYIPFPVGFDRRTIFRPTRPGNNYLTWVVLKEKTSMELVFDLMIYDRDGRISETVTGLAMRDVGVVRGSQ